MGRSRGMDQSVELRRKLGNRGVKASRCLVCLKAKKGRVVVSLAREPRSAGEKNRCPPGLGVREKHPDKLRWI